MATCAIGTRRRSAACTRRKRPETRSMRWTTATTPKCLPRRAATARSVSTTRRRKKCARLSKGAPGIGSLGTRRGCFACGSLLRTRTFSSPAGGTTRSKSGICAKRTRSSSCTGRTFAATPSISVAIAL
eukprot:Amastigsp_a174780_71.p2 type:complete len:129 gc:universal Amastigsp_a174780_71:766-380(-)